MKHRLLAGQEIIKSPFSTVQQEIMEQLGNCLHGGIYEIERQNLKPADIVMGRRAYSYLRQFFNEQFNVLSSTPPSMIRCNMMGTFWGINVWTSDKLSLDDVKFYHERDHRLMHDFASIAQMKSEMKL